MFVLSTCFRVTVDHLATSALHALADVAPLSRDVGEVPNADIRHHLENAALDRNAPKPGRTELIAVQSIGQIGHAEAI